MNMRGCSDTADTGLNNKWKRINQIMKEKNLAILAVQEAHLKEEMDSLFEKRLIIRNSQGDNLNARGVAIVINKEKN